MNRNNKIVILAGVALYLIWLIPFITTPTTATDEQLDNELIETTLGAFITFGIIYWLVNRTTKKKEVRSAI